MCGRFFNARGLQKDYKVGYRLQATGYRLEGGLRPHLIIIGTPGSSSPTNIRFCEQP